MRKEIEVEVSAAYRARLEAIVADRNSPQKHVWRARIILATADGCGTAAVMRRAGVAKPSVWRWQERFMSAGVDGLLHDKTRWPDRRGASYHGTSTGQSAAPRRSARPRRRRGDRRR
jgi:hypothetical protein